MKFKYKIHFLIFSKFKKLNIKSKVKTAEEYNDITTNITVQYLSMDVVVSHVWLLKWIKTAHSVFAWEVIVLNFYFNMQMHVEK